MIEDLVGDFDFWNSYDSPCAPESSSRAASVQNEVMKRPDPLVACCLFENHEDQDEELFENKKNCVKFFVYKEKKIKVANKTRG